MVEILPGLAHIVEAQGYGLKQTGCAVEALTKESNDSLEKEKNATGTLLLEIEPLQCRTDNARAEEEKETC